jgi:hypothetical protein
MNTTKLTSFNHTAGRIGGLLAAVVIIISIIITQSPG